MSQTTGIDNSNPAMNTLIPSQNMFGIGIQGGRYSQLAPLQKTLNQTGGGTFNPMFGRPIWSYVQSMAGPVRGPQPRLARGTGLTGDPSLPGNAAQLPGYLSDNQYEPTTFSYDTVNRPSFTLPIPKSIGTGEDGREMVGTYKPHDFTPGTRFNHHMRQAASWQVYEYPPDFRNLLSWQQVQKYRIRSFTLSPRPLDSSNYFVGYQINPQVAAQIGQGTMGYMGSS